MKRAKAVIAVMTLATAFAAASANATVIIDVSEVGGDLVFTAEGSLDITGASVVASYPVYNPGLIPGGANWYVAPGPGGPTVGYALTSFEIPFGTSLTFFNSPTSLSGDNFFIWGQGGAIAQVGLPDGYISGSMISSGMIYNGATIAGFTLIPGTYEFTLPNDTIILNIGVVVDAPEPATLTLLGLGLAGIGFLRRRK